MGLRLLAAIRGCEILIFKEQFVNSFYWHEGGDHVGVSAWDSLVPSYVYKLFYLKSTRFLLR